MNVALFFVILCLLCISIYAEMLQLNENTYVLYTCKCTKFSINDQRIFSSTKLVTIEPPNMIEIYNDETSIMSCTYYKKDECIDKLKQEISFNNL